MKMETTLRGVGVSHGVAIGPVRHMGTAVLEPPAKQIPEQDAPREQNRAQQAVEAVAADLVARGNLAGGEAQAVLEAQAMMAQDPELMADVERRIAVGSSAERAIYDAFAAYRALLAAAGDYWRAGWRTWTTCGTGSWPGCSGCRCRGCRTATSRMC
jgi:phosphotransferase system enzyme I (PtsI)